MRGAGVVEELLEPLWPVYVSVEYGSSLCFFVCLELSCDPGAQQGVVERRPSPSAWPATFSMRIICPVRLPSTSAPPTLSRPPASFPKKKRPPNNNKQFTSQVTGAADAEFGALCREMDVEAQLADLEALCMRRGLSAEAQQ